MKRYILRLVVSVLTILLLCCGVSAAAEEGGVNRLTDVAVAERYELVLLDEQDNSVTQTTDTVNGTETDVYKNVVKMKLSINDASAREYVVMLLDGGTKVPGDANIRYIDQKSGPGVLEFLVYPDQMTQPGDYTLMMFSGGIQSEAATFTVAEECGIASGYCGGEGDGTNLTWVLQKDGKLVIRGIGTMANFDASTTPWDDLTDKITTVTVACGVTTIGKHAFSDCGGVVEVTLGADVVTIGEYAFNGCGMTSVTIPVSTTGVAPNAFHGCRQLTEILVEAGSSAYSSFDGVLFNREQTKLICYPNGKSQTQYTIPDGVTVIGTDAFKGCSVLRGVTVSGGVKTIEDRAFYHCSALTSVVIPEGLTTIGGDAFAGTKLVDVTIPASVTNIGNWAFGNCDSLIRIEFLGNEPSVGVAIFNRSTNVTVYYHEGTNGWLKSQHYDASAGTWCGHPLVMIETEEPVQLFSLYNANMELGNSLTMYFYLKQADIKADKDYYVTIAKTYADGRADVVKTIPEEEWVATTDGGVPVYRVGFEGIAAKEMADDLKVQVFTTDGKHASNLLTYNIRTYAMTMLRYFPSGELATLFVDMLNYGAAAQTFFKYNTDDLANAQLTPAQQTLATQSVDPVNNRVVGPMYYNVSLQLESNILLQMYFSGITPGTDARVSYMDHYGKQKTAEIPFEDFVHYSGNIYYINVEGLAVADGRQLVTCELYDENDVLVGRGTDSVESYIATMNQVAPNALYTQIMKFIDSAYKYFH